MTKFVLDVLTVIPPNEILSKGVPYVKTIIEKELKPKDDKDKWNYFQEKYLIKKNIKCWNIHSDDDSHLDLQNRTNNALERYNRSFNDKFSSPHPSLLQFVTTIEE